MDSRRLRLAAIVLLAVLAFAFAAATVDSAVETGGGFGGQPGLQPIEGNASDNASDGGDGGFSVTFQAPCITFLRTRTFWVMLAAVAIVVLGSITLYEDALSALAIAMAVTPMGFIAYLVLASCGPRTLSLIDFRSLFRGGSGNASLIPGGSEASTRPAFANDLLVVLVAGFLLAVVVAAFLSIRADGVFGGGSRTGPPAAEEERPDRARLRAIGDLAGEAADRIAGEADVENEVYRAWREMTTHLDVDRPESSTPVEFAAAAREAGMAPADVDELTALFREVRYGDAAPTADREERALEALRRIEREYGGASE